MFLWKTRLHVQCTIVHTYVSFEDKPNQFAKASKFKQSFTKKADK